MTDQSPVDVDQQLRQLRLLINDTDTVNPVFSDDDLADYLALEGGVLKLAAAQILDTIADDEALTSKVIRTAAGTSTDGAKVADSLRKRAQALRDQVDADDDGFFSLVDVVGHRTGVPELTEPPTIWL